MKKNTEKLIESFVEHMTSQGWTVSDPDTLQFSKFDEEYDVVTIAQVDYSSHVVEVNGLPTVTKAPSSVDELVDSLVEEEYFVTDDEIEEHAENFDIVVSEYEDAESLKVVIAELMFEDSISCMMPAVAA